LVRRNYYRLVIFFFLYPKVLEILFLKKKF
jgi:hypothetical protein